MSLKLGTTAPNFKAETTEGPIQLYDWTGDDWVCFFLASSRLYTGMHD